ncbi:hypothetical protein CEB3_c05090 [Peptococcaceae bacterium CEB3]|nr:hypothetical protein CEB3_c05090 [Peptococcaceae bacterium CEB3]
MAYFSRKPEGIFWTQKKARTYHICLGSMDCKGISPGETYWERTTRLKGKPAKFCQGCAEKRKEDEGGWVEG